MRPIVRRGKWLYAKNRQPGNIAPPFLGDSRVGFMHAHKGGVPVLRGDSTWRTVNGFVVNHPWGFFTITFRRFWS